jgi:hypothetical protein
MNLWHYTEAFCLSMYDPLLEVLNGFRRNLVLEEWVYSKIYDVRPNWDLFSF